MKKLKLDELQVESFETGSDGAAGRGTVHAHVLYTDIRYCGSGEGCYTDNEPECATQWYGCNTNQCSRFNCKTIEGVDCY